MWEYNYDYLAHHGILGQKWSIRRFQNPDGTLTEAGKKRYKIDSKGNIVKKTKEEKSIDNSKQALNNKHFYTGTKEKFLETITDPCIESPESMSSYEYNYNKKIKKAADAGLKALRDMGKLSWWGKDDKLDDSNPDMEGHREWFMAEDQTIGYPVIADLVINKGYTPNEILKLCNEMKKASHDYDIWDSVSDKCSDAIFQLTAYKPEEYSKFAEYLQKYK